MKLDGRLVPLSDITPQRRTEMFLLMDRFYENVTREHFQADLAEKQWVIELFDAHTGRLEGFSTQMLLEVEGLGEPVTALYSGDTIISPDHWGDIALSHVWGTLAISLIDRFPHRRLVWFLISKGYKTYRFLPVFFHEFYPRHDGATPAWAAAAIDALANHKFPGQFDPMAGVIRAAPGKDRLRAGVAEITEHRLRDPHVAFFVHANPGHAAGDELCCLAPLTRENFTPAGRRVIEARNGPEVLHHARQPA